MPTSNIETVPVIIRIVKKLNPKSILDFGIGFGKYGFLLREYLDVYRLANGFQYTLSDNFSTKIDGIEISDSYVGKLQRIIYNEIFIGDGFKIIDQLDKYDVVLLLDVLEHFDKEKGHLLLEKILQKTTQSLIIVTPAFNYVQGIVYNNENEKHRSFWQVKDFNKYENIQCKIIGGTIMLVIIHKKIKIKIPTLREEWSGRYLLKKLWGIILELVPKVIIKLKTILRVNNFTR